MRKVQFSKLFLGYCSHHFMGHWYPLFRTLNDSFHGCLKQCTFLLILPYSVSGVLFAELITVCMDSCVIYACGFNRMEKLSGFAELWESLDSIWILTNVMYSDRVFHPLSNNVYFVRIYEDSLVIHIEFSQLCMYMVAKINKPLWC